MKPALSQLEEDVLSEIFNIGVGKAAAALSQLAREEVTLSVPRVIMMQHLDASKWITKELDSSINAVHQMYSGDFTGNAMLMIPQAQSLNLVRTLLAQSAINENLTEIEEEALLEIGNIILNACFGTVSNLLQLDVEISIPELKQGKAEQLVPFANAQQWALLLEIKFELKTQAVSGFLSFMMDHPSLHQITTATKSYLNQHLGHG